MQLPLPFPDCLPSDTPEQAEIRRFLVTLPDCPVVGRGECDCAACRFAWPEEYDHPPRPPKPVEKQRKATKGLREWTVEEINQLPGVQGNY